ELALAGVAGRDVDDNRAQVTADREAELQRPAGLGVPAARRSRRESQGPPPGCPVVAAAGDRGGEEQCCRGSCDQATARPGRYATWLHTCRIRVSEHARKPVPLRRLARARPPELGPPDGG